MEINIGDYTVELEIIRKNNKNIYFRFKDDKLIVTAHKLVSEKEILKLIKQNEDSLEKMYLKTNKKKDNNVGFNIWVFHM